MVTGSHCDAIPLAGAYDGTLGVIGAIAAVKGLNASGFVPRRSIEVLMFTSEEPTRFGLGCIGRCPDFDFESILNPRFWRRPIILNPKPLVLDPAQIHGSGLSMLTLQVITMGSADGAYLRIEKRRAAFVWNSEF